MARGPDVTRVRAITQLCGLPSYCGVIHDPERAFAVQALSALRPYPAWLRLSASACRVACGGAHLSRGCSTSKDSFSSAVAEETARRTTGAAESGRRRAPSGPLVKSGAPSGGVRSAPARPQPSPEQLSLGEYWNHVLRGGRVAKAQTAPPPQLSPQVAETPKKAQASSTSKKARSKKPAPKVSAAPKKAPTKQKASPNSA